MSNSLGWAVHTVHSIEVPRSDLVVHDAAGALVATQMVAIPNQPNAFELLIEVRIPAAGYNTYYIRAASDERELRASMTNERHAVPTVEALADLSNSYLTVDAAQAGTLITCAL